MTQRPFDVVVFRTGLLHEADLVSEALEEAGVPNYQRSEMLGGPEFGMRPSPVPGPGVLFVVKTDSSLARQALRVIQTLPVSHDNSSGPWAFHPRPESKPIFVVIAVLVAIPLLLGLVRSLIEVLRQLLR